MESAWDLTLVWEPGVTEAVLQPARRCSAWNASFGSHHGTSSLLASRLYMLYYTSTLATQYSCMCQKLIPLPTSVNSPHCFFKSFQDNLEVEAFEVLVQVCIQLSQAQYFGRTSNSLQGQILLPHSPVYPSPSVVSIFLFEKVLSF